MARNMATPQRLRPGTQFRQQTDSFILGDILSYCGIKETVYTTQRESNGALHAVKVDRANNKKVYLEMKCYLRIHYQGVAEWWARVHSLPPLGIPKVLTQGAQHINGIGYRFIVTEKVGECLESAFMRHNRQFSVKTVITLGLRILDVLQYLHYSGYVHGDIKGSKLFLGTGRDANRRIYLIDCGFAWDINDPAGALTPRSTSPNQRHLGTRPFISRDGHSGSLSRRGDLETLGYNLLHWLGYILPWESYSRNQPSEESNAMLLEWNDIRAFLRKCSLNYGPQHHFLIEYFEYLCTTEYDTNPDYNLVRSILKEGLVRGDIADDGELGITPSRKRVSQNQSYFELEKRSLTRRSQRIIEQKESAKQDEPVAGPSHEYRDDEDNCA